jgi:hypothetical protein
MRIFESRIELLNDAIDYYWGRPDRKCIDPVMGTCQYRASQTSEGCAIGRLLDPVLAASLQQTMGVNSDTIFNQLPEWLRSMGQNFLKSLQDLHDWRTFIEMNKKEVFNEMKDHVDLDLIIFPNAKN